MDDRIGEWAVMVSDFNLHAGYGHTGGHTEMLGCPKKEAATMVRNGDLAIRGAVQQEPRWQVVLDEARTVTTRVDRCCRPAKDGRIRIAF